MSSPVGFRHSSAPEPHRERTRRILEEHPELRGYIGHNRLSSVAIVLIVALQLTLAILVREQPWWGVLVAAYLLGAFADHALYVLIHECAHNLVFRSRAANSLAGIVANVPLLVPSSVSFQRYHLKHHAFQGVYELDADIPSVWEGRLVGRTALGKAVWLLLYPLVQITRPLRLREIPFFSGWLIVNVLLVLSADVLIALTLGRAAFGYLLASLFFSIGLHPLGARWIQRHYVVEGFQETYSYYGPLNRLAFNVGYHNEHHDFPSVPWNRLPLVHGVARPWYDSLASHRSWTRLLLRFLFDPSLNLHSRVVRGERNGVGLDEDAAPDIQKSAAAAVRAS